MTAVMVWVMVGLPLGGLLLELWYVGRRCPLAVSC